MAPTTQLSVNAALSLLVAGGVPSTPALQRLLDATDVPPDDSEHSPANLHDAALAGFFESAARGTTLTHPARVTAKFGRTLEQNYPEAGAAFIKFAATYWTLKLVVIDGIDSGDRSLAAQLLAAVEPMVAGPFFPTPGPVKFEPTQREAAQRQALKEHGPSIDVEDFIAHNPILIRDRLSRRGGCAGTTLLGVCAAAALSILASIAAS